ncbi:MAG: DUF4136 domain-containing protein [Mucilaginibacter sp.]|uniref:DUF4136 domain-containing protein n=1 Tax=Mucilaginibacter sp. L3T2-6 TaxID=3062491 RepID=UPI002675AF86|nr:DUF4136 domain-containing protein [Mucilaginibacter sp. L3T2-6]MDO3642344.1 DUF4136 domain-containing protein [Mucilaginibacter sp. L3T2-6]MDV6214839.1 DUF4136 domain-containing protein [Mucilaginibacter sp. L3T2-6]
MKRLIYLGLTAITLIGLSACNSYNYYTAAINKTNLSSYHTFAWMPPSGRNDKTVNNEADAKIKDATTNALVMKGLRLSQRNPDLIVSYTTTVGRGARTNYYTPGYYGGWGYPGWGLGFGWGGWGGYGWGGFYRPYYYAYGGPFLYGGPTYAEKEHYKEGTLIIDLIDPHTRKIVWRGFGVGEVHKNPQKNIDDLPKVVDGVLNQLQLTPNYASR